ncbi:MAG: hypothetical protein BWZ02_03051 [Lentisphaerae bacterium ADurb.BinA184]|nr:MAG: hypothetical protein BWZ02_03051 [Lentisphaerae bacterium ADurb.BinA184]
MLWTSSFTRTVLYHWWGAGILPAVIAGHRSRISVLNQALAIHSGCRRMSSKPAAPSVPQRFE